MRKFFFDLTLAFRAIANNKLRAVLTIAIIGLGIMALVGILTAIEVMKESFYTNFSRMGVNSFQLTSSIIQQKKHGGGMNITVTQDKNISYDEAREFRERFQFPATVS